MTKLLLSGVLFLLIASPLAAEDPDIDPEVDWARAADPAIDLPPPVVQWPADMQPLWRKALRHAESDLRRQAADSIVQAHQLGMPGLDESTDELMNVLKTANEHPVARTAATRALVAVDARHAASLLVEHTRRGPIELSLLAEPALAQWDFEPARAIWLERLSDPSTSPAYLQLAFRCLAHVGEVRAIPELERLVMAQSSSAVLRLAAAKALATLPASDLLEMARLLATDSSPRGFTDRLVGVHLLASQSGDEALALLDQYAAAPEPTIAAQAMQRLLEIAPERLVQRAATTIESPDARIRHLTVEALATAPSEASIATLVPVLDDVIPEIRDEARRVLLTMSGRDELRAAVIEGAERVLARDQWRGLQQAILILTELDQKQVGERLLQLLHHARPEVSVSAAWGLKTLAVPDLIEPMFDQAKRFSADAANVELPTVETASEISAHLLEAMGPMNHEPAEAYLRNFIPKSSPYPEGVRAAAIWSLGYLWADEDPLDLELVSQLEERLADWASVPPEMTEVRTMSAVALGRMKSEASLKALRHWYVAEGANSQVGACCGWAIEQITGETLPPPEPFTRQVAGWFLKPHQTASEGSSGARQ